MGDEGVSVTRKTRARRGRGKKPGAAAPEGAVSRPPSVEPPRDDLRSLPPPSKEMSREELTERYMPYVRAIAGKIKKTLSKEIEYDDLLSYGMLGLFEAADRFDASRGASFMTFSYYRIRGSIYDGLRGMGWVSRTEYQRFRFEQHATSYLQNVEEQAQAAPPGMKRSEDEQINELANVVEGLVTIYVTALDAMEGLQVKDEAPLVDESLEVQQARALVAEALEKMGAQEKKLLTLYYYKDMSLEAVGKELGLSKSWTSRLHSRAIQKMGRLLHELAKEEGEPPSKKTRRLGATTRSLRR